jgi:hypothetical protein
MSKLTEQIQAQAKHTIGYMETNDKSAFLSGVATGSVLTENQIEKALLDKETEARAWKVNYETIRKDMKTLTSILNQYTES